MGNKKKGKKPTFDFSGFDFKQHFPGMMPELTDQQVVLIVATELCAPHFPSLMKYTGQPGFPDLGNPVDQVRIAIGLEKSGMLQTFPPALTLYMSLTTIANFAQYCYIAQNEVGKILTKEDVVAVIMRVPATAQSHPSVEQMTKAFLEMEKLPQPSLAELRDTAGQIFTDAYNAVDGFGDIVMKQGLVFSISDRLYEAGRMFNEHEKETGQPSLEK